jgi:hypothetical protein
MTTHASKNQNKQTIILIAGVLLLLAAMFFFNQAQQGKFPLPGNNAEPITVSTNVLTGGGSTPADI